MKVMKFAIAALLLVSGSAFAATITDTKHDLSKSGTDTTGGGDTVDNGQICVYCHTPHAAKTDAPLWNRGAPATSTFTLYSSDTLDMTIGQPGASSKLCLSCHDGATAIDAIFNAPNKGWVTSTTDRVIATNAAGYFGQDLSNDHPIGIQYATSSDNAFRSIAQVTSTESSGGLWLDTDNSNQVECASCHQVHSYTYMPFLRKSNDNSALCLTCHIK